MVKLNRIDGGAYKQCSMWFNSMQREEPYLGLKYIGRCQKWQFPQGSLYRCCMAVVSSCREVLG